MIDVTENNAHQTILDTDGLAMLYFTASWCGPCRMLKPTLQKLEDELEGRLSVLRVDVDEQSELARDYSIMSVPTMIVFKKGSPVKTVVGVKPKNKLLQEFEDFLD